MIKLPDEKIHEIAMRAHATCLRIGGSHYNAAQIAIEEIQRLNATAQPVSDGWVKCSERMPDEENYYLTYSNAGVDVTYFDGEIFSDKYAFHWMPLPAAPGGQDD